MVLFIFFFTVQISWKIFFKCHFGFTHFLSPPSNISAVVILSIGDQRIIFPPLELEAPLPTEGQLGKLD